MMSRFFIKMVFTLSRLLNQLSSSPHTMRLVTVVSHIGALNNGKCVWISDDGVASAKLYLQPVARLAVVTLLPTYSRSNIRSSANHGLTLQVRTRFEIAVSHSSTDLPKIKGQHAATRCRILSSPRRCTLNMYSYLHIQMSESSGVDSSDHPDHD